jgi:hydroxyacylglutathione hydrolase
VTLRPRFWIGGFAVAAFILLVGLALAFAPLLYGEAEIDLAPMKISLLPKPLPAFAARPGPALGAVVDGYWRVQHIGPDTWAIGEPQDDPDNYEYLLIGTRRALLVDSGSSRLSLAPVLAKLTQAPVTVIPTHLHFDHTSGLGAFTSIAMIDLPQTRADVRHGQFTIGRYQFLGTGRPPSFRVTEWIAPDGWLDLGGRRVQVLWTPGHTATSLSVYDQARGRLFTGDFLYPTSLYAFQPDSSLSAYQASAERLLARLPADTIIYGAHCCRNDAQPQAPWLSMQDLRDLRTALQAVRTGASPGRGLLLRRFPVNSRMTLLALYPFGNP